MPPLCWPLPLLSEPPAFVLCWACFLPQARSFTLPRSGLLWAGAGFWWPPAHLFASSFIPCAPSSLPATLPACPQALGWPQPSWPQGRLGLVLAGWPVVTVPGLRSAEPRCHRNQSSPRERGTLSREGVGLPLPSGCAGVSGRFPGSRAQAPLWLAAQELRGCLHGRMLWAHGIGVFKDSLLLPPFPAPQLACYP